MSTRRIKTEGGLKAVLFLLQDTPPCADFPWGLDASGRK